MTANSDEELKEITLSPEVRRIRNSIIKKFAHEPLDIMAKFVKDVVENEEETVKRLGAMAARVEILRMRISQISDESINSNFDNFTEEAAEEENDIESNLNEIVITSPNLSDWVRLRIIENSEINGVRFPKGVVIDVSQEDGDRLLESGKASYVDEDEIADIKSDVSLKSESNANLLSAAAENPDETLNADEDTEDSDTLNVDEDSEGTTPVTDVAEELGGSIPSADQSKDLEIGQLISDSKPDKKKSEKNKTKMEPEEVSVSISETENPEANSPTLSEADTPEQLLAGFNIDETDTKT